MGTPQHINTVVKGSVGTLEEAAEALRKAEHAADSADDDQHSARSTAHSQWEGEGAEAFLSDLEPQLNFTRDLHETCQQYRHAFDALTGTLQAVKDDMAAIRTTATSGGLELQGPIVLRPEQPGPAPSASEYAGDQAGYDNAVDEHQAAVDDFNAKAEVFNTCLAHYKDARNKEEQGHTDFWEAVDADEGFDLNQSWSIGTTTASAALAGAGEMHNQRANLLTKIQSLQADSKTYQAIASGDKVLSGMTAKQRMQVMNDVSRSKGSERMYRKQLKQLDKASKYVPKGLQNLAAANPSGLANNPETAKRLSKAFNRLPWAGSGITVFNEARQAATGEQTWGKAVADSTGILAGGAAGGAAGSALCSPLFPPFGPIVCGTGGALLGGFAGEKAMDIIVPEESDFPDKVSQVPDPTPAGTP